MSDLERLGFVALGVAISVVLPPAPGLASETSQTVRREMVRQSVGQGSAVRRHRGVSLVVAVLLLVFIGDTITSSKAALAAGYGFDSTLQKFYTGNISTD